MQFLPPEKLVAVIKEKTGLGEAEINSRIEAKLAAFGELISRQGAAHIVANELGVPLSGLVRRCTIAELRPGARDVEVVGKVLRVMEPRAFESERGPGKVASLWIADPSGSIRVALWHSQADHVGRLKLGDIVKIKGGYVRGDERQRELHLSASGSLAINPEGEVVDVTASSGWIRKTIAALSEGDQGVEIAGHIVQASELRFFESCPLCMRRARPRGELFVCDDHDIVSPKLSYMLNLVLDDGSGMIRALLFRAQAARLLGQSESELLALKGDQAGLESLRAALLGRAVRFGGRVQRNAIYDQLEFVAQIVLEPEETEVQTVRIGQTK